MTQLEERIPSCMEYNVEKIVEEKMVYVEVKKLVVTRRASLYKSQKEFPMLTIVPGDSLVKRQLEISQATQFDIDTFNGSIKGIGLCKWIAKREVAEVAVEDGLNERIAKISDKYLSKEGRYSKELLFKCFRTGEIWFRRREAGLPT